MGVAIEMPSVADALGQRKYCLKSLILRLKSVIKV